MKKYLLLAEICFDWSHGEYADDYVPDIFLGIVECENEVYAMSQARVLLEKYCNDINKSSNIGARDYNSDITIRELN